MNKRKKKLEPIVLNEQVLPSAKELEMVVLGSILLEGDIMNRLASIFSTSLFNENEHKIIAETMINLYKSNKPIDIISVCNDLNQNKTLEEVGGAYYVSSLSGKVASTVNVDYHVKILQQKSLERNMVHICNTSLLKVLSYKEDIFDVFSSTQLELDNALKDVLTYEIKKISDIHLDIIERNINVIEKGIKSGTPTGLRLLDNLTNGWQKSDLVILAGRPGSGKTATAVSMIIHPAIEQNIPVAIFSLEMSNFQIGSRIQSYLSGVNVSKIVKGQLNMDEIRTINRYCDNLNKAPLFIDDTPNISLLELKSKVRKLVREEKVELVVIDYLQLMRSGMDISNREQEIAEISKGLKGLAKELNIPIIALSQLSRLVESRSDKKPMLSDLRESGQIEQDADMVIFCYRPEYYGIEQYEIGNQTFDGFGLMMLIVAKHRNGELGEIPLRFIHEQAKLDNYSTYETNNYNNNTNNSKINDTFVPQNQGASKMENNMDFLNSNNNEKTPF